MKKWYVGVMVVLLGSGGVYSLDTEAGSKVVLLTQRVEKLEERIDILTRLVGNLVQEDVKKKRKEGFRRLRKEADDFTEYRLAVMDK